MYSPLDLVALAVIATLLIVYLLGSIFTYAHAHKSDRAQTTLLIVKCVVLVGLVVAMGCSVWRGV